MHLNSNVAYLILCIHYTKIHNTPKQMQVSPTSDKNQQFFWCKCKICVTRTYFLHRKCQFLDEKRQFHPSYMTDDDG